MYSRVLPFKFWFVLLTSPTTGAVDNILLYCGFQRSNILGYILFLYFLGKINNGWSGIGVLG